MLKAISNFYVVTLLFCTLTVGLILSSSTTSSASTTADAAVTVGSACTMTATVDTPHNAEIPNGTNRTEIGTTTLNTICNDSGGFAIYAVGYSNNEYGNTTMINQADSNITFNTGTATSGSNSNWSMKLSQVTTGTFATTIDNSFNNYHNVPNTYTKVAHRDSATDAVSANPATGTSISATYQTFISPTQAAGTYQGKVKYTMVHPATDIPPSPQPSTAGYINYYANATTAEGSMGRQSARDGNTVKLFASNFSRDGYGFAGWSDAYDYSSNPNAHFYGPNEDIVVPTGTTANGLALYAVWIKSEGDFQDTNIVSALCGSGPNSLTPVAYIGDTEDQTNWSITANLSNITALTDIRDKQTYAIAKLSDNKCWMIENLRISDAHQEKGNTVPTVLTTTNTNNPLNKSEQVIPVVTLKHNYTDTETYPTLSSPDTTSWCTANSSECNNQTKLRADNTINRATYSNTTTLAHNASLYTYGNYYNWYSATAGRGTFEKTGTTVGDICPYGWHLPTGNTSGDFGILSNSLGGYKNSSNAAQQMDSSTTPTGSIMSKRLRHFPNNFLLSSWVNIGSIYKRGSDGYYWTSRSWTSNIAYYLQFDGSSVYPGNGSGLGKPRGFSIRCVASSI